MQTSKYQTFNRDKAGRLRIFKWNNISEKKTYWFRSQWHCFDGHVLSLICCLAVGREYTWSVHWTGQLKKLIISFETKRTYKVTTVFVFESNEESLSKIWFSPSSNFVLWFVCFIIPQVTNWLPQLSHPQKTRHDILCNQCLWSNTQM